MSPHAKPDSLGSKLNYKEHFSVEPISKIRRGVVSVRAACWTAHAVSPLRNPQFLYAGSGCKSHLAEIFHNTNSKAIKADTRKSQTSAALYTTRSKVCISTISVSLLLASLTQPTEPEPLSNPTKQKIRVAHRQTAAMSPPS